MRLMIILCIALLSMSVPGRAHAQAQGYRCTTPNVCDEGEAYAEAVAFGAERQATLQAQEPGVKYPICLEKAAGAFTQRVFRLACGNGSSSARETFYYKGLCLSRVEETGWASSAQRVCHNGCAYGLYGDGAGGHYYSTFNDATNAGFGTCTQSEDTPAPKPGGGTDPGEGGGIDPGEGGGTDPGGGGGTDPGGGGGTDPGGGGGTDPEPKPCPEGGKDADGKPCPGEGGGTDPGGGSNPGNGGGSGAGSGTCATPPVCSGDAIQCAQLFQQWRAGCQAEGLGGKVTGNPSDCKASYTCEGNAVACAQVHLLRQQLCGAGQGDGDGSLTGDGTCAQQFVCTGGDPVACAELKQVHMLRCAVEKLTKEGNGDDDYGETLEATDYVGVSEKGLGADGLDAGGWLGGGSCPAMNNAILTQLGVKGLDVLCDGASILGMYILFLGWMHASFILGRSLIGGG